VSHACHNQVQTRRSIPRRPETVSAGQIALRVIVRQRNSADVRLGVKWSQVSDRVNPTRVLAAKSYLSRLDRPQLLPVEGMDGNAVHDQIFGIGNGPAMAVCEVLPCRYRLERHHYSLNPRNLRRLFVDRAQGQESSFTV
jgi:hypothetical protein